MAITKEILTLSNYTIRNEENSLVDPMETIVSFDEMLCPACKKKHRTPGHGYSLTCDCGLQMQVWGNGLHCEKTVGEASA